jgi:hypothetical protein
MGQKAILQRKNPSPLISAVGHFLPRRFVAVEAVVPSIRDIRWGTAVCPSVQGKIPATSEKF